MEHVGSFRFAYTSPVIRYGTGSVGTLGEELEELGCDRALVVTGRTVGTRSAVIDPIREGLGDRLAGVAAATTPKKRLRTAIDCADRAREHDVDVLVGAGGASSLDVARVTAAVLASDRTPEELHGELISTGTIAISDDPLPVVAVPTTLAGGSLSMLAGVSADDESGGTDELVGGGVGDPRLMPVLAVYDPELVETTPRGILANSAMNGFNKGVETLYTSARTPVTDATAVRGLSLLADGLPTLAEGTGPAEWDLERVLQGVILAQYGTTRSTGTTFSLLHAIGHSLRVHAGVQLGVGHAVVADDALEWLFEAVDGRRNLLADALGVETDDADPAGDVVDAIRGIRADLGLPARIRDVEGVERSILDDVATTAAENFLLTDAPPSPSIPADDDGWTEHTWSGSPHAPSDLTISTPEVRGILESAW